MSFETVSLTLASAVATAGTFTVGYPTGTTDSHFDGGHRHVMMANQSKFTAPEDFTISFGDTVATVTYNGTTTLPAGSKVIMQFDRPGDDTDVIAKTFSGGAVILPKNVTMRRVYGIDLGSALTANSSGVSASQSVAAGAAFLLNGTLSDGSGSFCTFDVPRNVVAAWTTTSVLTITGYDVNGQLMVETSASGASHTGKKAFARVISITSSASITSATVGTGVVLGIPAFVADASDVLFEVTNGVKVARAGGYMRIPFQITEAEADTGGTFYIPTGFAGSVVGAGITWENTITTGGTVTVTIAGTTVAGLGLVVADGVTAGSSVVTDGVLTLDGTEVFTAVQPLGIVIPSAFNASAPLNGYVEVKRTSSFLQGTFVGGLAVGTKSTGTTADVYGTYSPLVAPDGTTGSGLIVMLDDVTFLGNKQFAG